MTPPREIVTILKACELVGVSRRTIYNWISKGKLEYIRTAGGSIRIFKDSLWQREGQGAPKASTLKPTGTPGTALPGGAGCDAAALPTKP